MRRKGFTLVELLVVIAIIALLMGILMPALARVRQLAFRMTCGTNLAGIGKACLIYSNDYDDELPKAGGRVNDWATAGIPDWKALTRKMAFFGTANPAANAKGKTTVTSNFYLLVKYAEVTPKQFVCKGETETRQFELSDVNPRPGGNFELTDAWDFGPYGTNKPSDYCSYSYHAPFGKWSLTVSSSPSMAVAADRNPWIPSPDGKTFAASPITGFTPDEDRITQYRSGTAETAKVGNSEAHQSDGQNVLFLDSHVSFEKRSYVGVENDNIYTVAVTSKKNNDDLKGKEPSPYVTSAGEQPKYRTDSYLVQETSEAVAATQSSGRTR